MAKATPGKPASVRVVYDHRCTATSMTGRCAYPVGLFAQGERNGKCLFHRGDLQPGESAEIVRRSGTVPYEEALKTWRARGSVSPGVKSTLEQMAQRGQAHTDGPLRPLSEEFARIIAQAKARATGDSKRRATK